MLPLSGVVSGDVAKELPPEPGQSARNSLSAAHGLIANCWHSPDVNVREMRRRAICDSSAASRVMISTGPVAPRNRWWAWGAVSVVFIIGSCAWREAGRILRMPAGIGGW